MRNLLFLLLLFAAGCATSRYYTMPTTEFKDIDYGFDTHYTAVRNITIGYIDEGQGPAILLIHGLGSNAKGWTKNISTLSEGHRVIAVDLPGYGKSDKGYYDYSMPFYTQVLSELLDKLSINSAVWIGHSMGGQIALTAALDHAERVSKLVLISPAGFETFEPGEGEWLRTAVTPEFVRDTPTRNIDINLRSNFYDTPDDAEFMITDRIQVRGASDFERYCYAVSKNVGGMIDGALYDRLPEIKQPTLVLFAENDGLIPNPYLHGGTTREVAEKGVAQMPNATLVMVPECGHFIQFEKADLANREILEFVD